MALVQTANDWTIGIHKQTNESTVGTVADYDFPIFSGRPQPVQSIERVNVTDAAAVVGDPYKQPNEHWEYDGVVPAFANVLGRFLQSIWPTDTKTGAGPYTHTFTGLGSGSTPWMSLYSKQGFSGNLSETFEAGQASAISFSFDQNGGPLKVGYKAVGKKPTVATFTTTTSAVLTDGYFTAAGGVLKFDEDTGTPATVTNIQSGTVTVDRSVTPQPTADSVSVSLISLGKVDPSFALTLLWVDWQAYRATYYGAVGGSAPSSTIVAGSVELNFVHSVQAGWSFKLTIPSAVMVASPPEPNPDGGPLIVPITGYATKPGSGEHVQPILINAVSTSY